VNVINDESLTDDECVMMDISDDSAGVDPTCVGQKALSSCSDLKITTKIPPWELTSAENIRSNAARSRQELVGFCSDSESRMPLDSYLIHAPACWQGWHTRCENPPPTLDLRSVWLALEAVVGLDGSARRIGLSNVNPPQLLDIVQFVKERQGQPEQDGVAPPRMPDVVQIYADPIRPAEEIRRICREYGIEFVSYSTLGTQHHMATGQNPVLSSPIVHALAEKHGRSTAEVVLSWALQNGMSIIPRSSKQQHIRELARMLPKDGKSGPTGFLDANDLLQMDSLKNSS
jgi:diketogulonate reductase-like aldo/keto reductase